MKKLLFILPILLISCIGLSVIRDASWFEYCNTSVGKDGKFYNQAEEVQIFDVRSIKKKFTSCDTMFIEFNSGRKIFTVTVIDWPENAK